MRRGTKLRNLVVVSAAIMVTGCAAETQSRRVASASAVMMNDYRQQVERFAAGQSALNADTERRIADFASMSERLRADSDQRRSALLAADDKPALSLMEHFAGPSFEQVIGRSLVLKSLQATPEILTLQADTSKVQAIVKQLNALKEAPSFMERLKNIDSYWSSLRQAYADSIQKAGTDAAATQLSTASATESALGIKKTEEGSR